MAKKLWIENIENPSVLWQEATPSGDWLDKTTDAIAWDKYGLMVRDYLFVRYEIQMILMPIANPSYPTIDFSGFFTVLTESERLLMCKYTLAPYALRTAVVSDAIDAENWDNLLMISQGTESNNARYTGRAFIIEKMRRYVAHKVRKEEMAMASTQQFFKDVFEFTEWYIRAACPDFKLWLSNLSPYDTEGFAQKSYYSESIKDDLLNIYENG